MPQVLGFGVGKGIEVLVRDHGSPENGFLEPKWLDTMTGWAHGLMTEAFMAYEKIPMWLGPV